MPNALKKESIKLYLYPIKIDAGKKQNIIKQKITITLWYFCKYISVKILKLSMFLRILKITKNAPTKNKFNKNLNSTDESCNVAPNFEKLILDFSLDIIIVKNNKLNPTIKFIGF
jgi:hypothetical protein